MIAAFFLKIYFISYVFILIPYVLLIGNPLKHIDSANREVKLLTNILLGGSYISLFIILAIFYYYYE